MKSMSVPTRSGFRFSQYVSCAPVLVPPPPGSHVSSSTHSLIPSVKRDAIAGKSGSSGGVKLVVSAREWNRSSPRFQDCPEPNMLGSNTSTFETDVREARTHMLADSFKVARREGASGKVETAIAGRVASEAPSCVNAHRGSPACGAAWTDVTRATAVRIETKTITLVPTLDPPTRRIRGHDFKADARWK